jgi:ABC-type branched-subunit amino acid transport system ATPase component
MVEARGVHKSYVGVEVLKGVDLTVERGEVTCLIGPSGSGRSTTPANFGSMANWWVTRPGATNSTSSVIDAYVTNAHR